MKQTLFLILILLIGFFGVSFAKAQTTPPPPVELFNPLAWVKVTSPEGLVLNGLQGFSGLIALVAIAFTVFNGFKLIIAGSLEPGKDQKRNEAKEGLLWSVGGFIVAILSFTLVSGVAKIIGFEPGLVGQDTFVNPIQGPAKPGDFISVMNFIMTNFLGLLGFVTTLVIIYYGYMYITAAGNEEEIKKAKDGLKWSVVGLIVVLLAFTIIASIRQYLIFGV